MPASNLSHADALRLRHLINTWNTDQSRASGVSTDAMRKQIAFERFLCRLFAVHTDEWMLKGGTALLIRTG